VQSFIAVRSEVPEFVVACRHAGFNPAVGDRIYTCTSTLFSTTSVFSVVTPSRLAEAYRPFGRIWLRYKLVLRCFAHSDLCSGVSSRDTSVTCSRTDGDMETYRRSAHVFGTTGASLGTKSAGSINCTEKRVTCCVQRPLFLGHSRTQGSECPRLLTGLCHGVSS
jgi:hypothetical protein